MAMKLLMLIICLLVAACSPVETRRAASDGDGVEIPAYSPGEDIVRHLGYIASSPKSSSTVILESDKEDPILTVWQYGLGRSAAWNSDGSG